VKNGQRCNIWGPAFLGIYKSREAGDLEPLSRDSIMPLGFPFPGSGSRKLRGIIEVFGERPREDLFTKGSSPDLFFPGIVCEYSC